MSSNPSKCSVDSDRLLTGMHQVCNHDLPNQLVALQSLLHMLHMEESSRLSQDGQEYVQRLQNVTQRTGAMARFLKEMSKLQGYAGKPEELSLTMLAREIQGALKQQFPHREFIFEWRWTVPSIVGDCRTVIQALNEMLTWLASGHAGPCRLKAATQSLENHTALHFELHTAVPADDNDHYVIVPHGGSSTLDKRMELVLSRAWLAVSDATLELTARDGSASRFVIVVPNQ